MELPRRFLFHDSELNDLNACAWHRAADPASPLELHLCGHTADRHVAPIIVHESQRSSERTERNQLILRAKWLRL
jgi:hypothetical protein